MIRYLHNIYTMHRSLKGVTQNIVYFHSIDVKIEKPNPPPSTLPQTISRSAAGCHGTRHPAIGTTHSDTACKGTATHISHNSHSSHQSCVITKCCAGLQTLHCSTQLHMHDSTVSSTRCVIMLYLHAVTPGPLSLSLSLAPASAQCPQHQH